VPPNGFARPIIDAKAVTGEGVEGNLKPCREPMQPRKKRFLSQRHDVERQWPIGRLERPSCRDDGRGFERQKLKRQHVGAAKGR
jgi:hypothetical protein